MRTALWPLQKAIYSRLTSDPKLMNRITGVHDEVSATALKPYVSIGDPTVTPFTTKSSFGEKTVKSIDTWGDYGGKKESYELLNLILQALTEPLKIEGSFSLFHHELVSMNVLNDPAEAGVKHGFMELRFYINN